jgi:2-methylisocitrate lyase-like PEP mutase family enzyme
MRKSLKSLLAQPQCVIAPGAFDGLSARLVEQAGFPAIYASGGAIARSCGFPDIGLLSFTEVCERLTHMCEATHLPIIADADTGYGNELNVARTVKTFERIGISALHIEDQQFPKRCGHLKDKSLISSEAMCIKIQAAINARRHKDFLIIARTDAIAVEGFEAAIARAQAYATAGADMLFIEAPESIEQIEQIAAQLPQPKLINMFYGGKTPLVPIERLQAMGYRLVIIPSDLQRAAIKAMQHTLQVIHANGDSHAINDQLATFQEREAIIGTSDYL